uniref:Uncharacterized protein n=1 Tax=Dictyopteris divaricata TaxID=156996 RepID=A0A4Y5T908_9PHAE|nr:hypothetical protein DicdiMp33 [Dictyopteris divaricata]QDB64142.1 hypothetical protein DicdiMp33 [Dictyopteris divaricata]
MLKFLHSVLVSLSYILGLFLFLLSQLLSEPLVLLLLSFVCVFILFYYYKKC